MRYLAGIVITAEIVLCIIAAGLAVRLTLAVLQGIYNYIRRRIRKRQLRCTPYIRLTIVPREQGREI